MTQYDHLSPVAAVYYSWNNEGSNPEYHREMQNLVRLQMPLLARALDRLNLDET